MNTLLNRDFTVVGDGWFQVVPTGEWPVTVQVQGAAVELNQVVDQAVAQEICNRFAEAAQRKNFPGLLVDFDHFSMDEAKPSEAAGWIEELQNRADGVYARIRWSDVGAEAVKGGRYRLVSPVFPKPTKEEVKNRVVRPKRLLSVALTNEPNMRGMVPISNRESGDPKSEIRNPNGEDEFRQGGDALAANRVTKGETMSKVATVLGLAAEASEDVIAGAVQALKNRADTAEGRVAVLDKENKDLVAGLVEQDLERLKNRFQAEKREQIKAALLANRAGTIVILEAMPEPKAEVAEVKAPLTNRATAKTPEGNTSNEAKPDQLERAVKECQLKNRCSFQVAWDLVRNEQPGLFVKSEA
jgi:phage I-like protein